MMSGERCRLGAGCVNCASPVLRGFGRFNWTRIKYCDTTMEKSVANVNTKRILNPKDPELLARSRAWRFDEVASQPSRLAEPHRSPTLQWLHISEISTPVNYASHFNSILSRTKEHHVAPDTERSTARHSKIRGISPTFGCVARVSHVSRNFASQLRAALGLLRAITLTMPEMSFSASGAYTTFGTTLPHFRLGEFARLHAHKLR